MARNVLTIRAQRSAAACTLAARCARGVVLGQLLQHAGVADDDRERVVELVRHAGQQGAERGELLALVQGLPLALDLGLGRALLGEVDDRGDECRLALILDQPRGGRGGECRAIQPAQVLLQAIDDAVRLHRREETLARAVIDVELLGRGPVQTDAAEPEQRPKRLDWRTPAGHHACGR